MELFDFTDTQWQAFTRAKAWGDGAPPVYCEDRLVDGRSFFLVMDAEGGVVMVESDEVITYVKEWFQVRPYRSQQDARADARKIRPPYKADDFYFLGFAPDLPVRAAV